MTGIESTQFAAESVQYVADMCGRISNDLDDIAHGARINGLPIGDASQALSDALADIDALRSLVAGLCDDARQREVEAVRHDAGGAE